MNAEYEPQPGQLLAGKYRITRAIGRGAMGIVFEAEHVATGKRVAVKWLHAHVMESRSAVERLVREAQASARVRHSNVVDVYDVEREGDALFLVMEYLEGEPLSQWLDRGGVPMHELLTVIVQAMRGVNEAHRRGIVHRDIKPDNIFLAYEPDQALPIAKVLDFGISKIDAPAGGLSLTQTGSALGTPLYMSYEQLSGVRDVDARSDVYAFGVILYEALSGTLPYSAENFAELAAKVITTEPIPLRQLRPDIPERLEQVVFWAMKKRREERAPNLSVLIDALAPYTAPQSGEMSLSSARLPSIRAVASLPLSSTPAPPPSSPGLRLDEPGSFRARRTRERRDTDEQFTSLIAGTMYEGRRKREKRGGIWMAIAGGAAAVAVGVVLATVTRNGDRAAQSQQADVSAPAQAESEAKPAAEAERPKRSSPPGALAPAREEAPTPLAPTQVEPMPTARTPDAPEEQPQIPEGQLPPPDFTATPPDAGANAAANAPANPNAKAPVGKAPPLKGQAQRPGFAAPSGEFLPPPPIIAPPEATAPPPPPSSALPTPYDAPLPSAPAQPDAPRAPVDVNPFDSPDPGDTYRAGKPREDEF